MVRDKIAIMKAGRLILRQASAGNVEGVSAED
jgi:hypothetical protein